MKKIIFWVLLTFSLFSIVQDLWAVSYNNSNTYSLPSVGLGSTIYFNAVTPAGIAWASLYYPAGTYKDWTNYVQNTVVWVDLRLFSFAQVIRFRSTDTYSGVLMSYNMIFWQSCWNGSALCPSSHFDIVFEPIGTSYNVYYNLYTRTDGPVNVYAPPVYVKKNIFMFTMDKNDICPGQTTDCLLSISPKFYLKTSAIGAWLYIPYVDFTYYYDNDLNSVFHREYFWSLTINWPEPTLWQSISQFFTLAPNDLWQFVSNHWQNILNHVRFVSSTNNQFYTYESVGIPNVSWDVILKDYFLWNTGSTSLSAYFPSWIGATGVISSTSNLVSLSGGSGSTGTGFYSTCSTLAVGCYIQGTYNAVSSIFTGLGDVWSDVSQLSWTGQFLYTTGSFITTWSWFYAFNDEPIGRKCTLSGLYTQYSLWDGFFRLKSDIGFMDDFLSWISLLFKVLLSPFVSIWSVFSNVYPPNEWSDVCLLGTVYTVHYQTLFAPFDATPTVISQLEPYQVHKWDTTILDYILLSVMGASSLAIIVYFLNLRSS